MPRVGSVRIESVRVPFFLFNLKLIKKYFKLKKLTINRLLVILRLRVRVLIINEALGRLISARFLLVTLALEPLALLVVQLGF